MQTDQLISSLFGKKENVTSKNIKIQPQNSVDNINLDMINLNNENCVKEIANLTSNTKHKFKQLLFTETNSNKKQETRLVQFEKKKFKTKCKTKIKRFECEKVKTL